MPRKLAAGCLVRATVDGERRFLIVHASGSYNRRRPWSIPKGVLEPGEEAEAAAVRETLEETGLACRIVAPLGKIDYRKTPKTVIAFLAEPIEPPPAAVLHTFDWEIDRAEFFSPEEARRLLHPDQQPFIDRALELEG